MKHLLIILLLIPSLAFAAFTEFYCQSGGSNLNAGSTTNNTAAYTSTNGNWSTVTNVFTPTDGSTPASTVAVGDFVSIYIDGAGVAVFLARVTAVAAGVNGGITVSATARQGTPPTTSATTRTLKAGGAWLGPNGASAFPFTIWTSQFLVNVAGDQSRINLKNNQTYSMTASITATVPLGTLQGYTSSPGDLGRATIDFGSTANLGMTCSGSFQTTADLILLSSATTGTGTGLTVNQGEQMVLRCTAKGFRGAGMQQTATGVLFMEDEVYDCVKANGSLGGFTLTSGGNVHRCISANNTGNTADGFQWAAGSTSQPVGMYSIATGNGHDGFSISQGGSTVLSTSLFNCDAHNNGASGIANRATTASGTTIIENCNLVKNGAWGILSTQTTGVWFGRIANCGFGSGSQQNTSGTISLPSIANVVTIGSVTYASGVTPWRDPANGDFRINLAAAMNTGIGSFMQSQGSLSGTVRYPDIGAAQHKDTQKGGTFGQ